MKCSVVYACRNMILKSKVYADQFQDIKEMKVCAQCAKLVNKKKWRRHWETYHKIYKLGMMKAYDPAD